MDEIESDNTIDKKSGGNVPNYRFRKRMLPSSWVLFYIRPITKEEMEVVEELRRVESQEVYLVYLYNSN